MKRLIWGLALCLAFVPVLYGQQAPTLGPTTGPSLRGPGSFRTANPHLLMKMRTVYIQRIDHDMSGKLSDDLSHVSWLKVVKDKDKADAIVRGTCFTLKNLKRLHTEIYITDRITGKAIWQDVIRVPYNPPSVPIAVNKTASEVVAHLDRSINVAAGR